MSIPDYPEGPLKILQPSSSLFENPQLEKGFAPTHLSDRMDHSSDDNGSLPTYGDVMSMQKIPTSLHM